MIFCIIIGHLILTTFASDEEITLKCHFDEYSYWRKSFDPRFEGPKETFYRCNLPNLNITADQTIKIDKTGYDNRNNLTEMIWIEKSELSTIPEEIFTEFPNLDYLFLFQTNLENLDGNIFQTAKNLKNLRFSNVYLPFINSSTFSELSSLEYLGIVHSEVQEIDADAFEGLNTLKGLYLYDNNIGSLDELTFAPLPNLEELFLNDNRLHNISENLFESNYKLKILMLNGNRISAVGSNIFGDKADLQYINFSNNICINAEFNITEDLETIIDQLEKCFLEEESDDDKIVTLMELKDKSMEDPDDYYTKMSEYIIPAFMGVLVMMIILVTIFAVCSYTSVIKKIFVIMDDVEQFPSSVSLGNTVPDKRII